MVSIVSLGSTSAIYALETGQPEESADGIREAFNLGRGVQLY